MNGVEVLGCVTHSLLAVLFAYIAYDAWMDRSYLLMALSIMTAVLNLVMALFS